MRGRVTAPASEFDWLGAESMNDRTCSLDGCLGKHVARGLCRSHYNAMNYAGVPMPPTTKPRWDDAAVSAVLSGSDLELLERKGKRLRVRCLRCGAESGLWLTHVVRGASGCRPCRLAVKSATHRTPSYGRWVGADAGYDTVHARLRAQRGKASEHMCVDCGGGAGDWSYIGGAPDERVERVGRYDLAYSTDLNAYVPRCRSCHKRHDLEARQVRQNDGGNQ